HPTHQRHRIGVPLGGNAGVLHRDSFAKNAAAFFKKSRSWRSTSTSRRKRRSSCSGVSPLGGGPPAARVSCCFQWRNWSGRILSSRATSLSGRSLSSASRTASCRNSGLKDRRCFMDHLTLFEE